MRKILILTVCIIAVLSSCVGWQKKESNTVDAEQIINDKWKSLVNKQIDSTRNVFEELGIENNVVWISKPYRTGFIAADAAAVEKYVNSDHDYNFFKKINPLVLPEYDKAEDLEGAWPVIVAMDEIVKNSGARPTGYFGFICIQTQMQGVLSSDPTKRVTVQMISAIQTDTAFTKVISSKAYTDFTSMN